LSSPRTITYIIVRYVRHQYKTMSIDKYNLIIIHLTYSID